MSGDLAIRRMDDQTVHQVAELEKACFDDPWSLGSLLGELANPSAVYLTAMRGQTVLGYLGMHHILDEGHITNLAVGPAYRREGVARMLLLELIAYARERNFAFLTLEVRASNQAAATLYSGLGFVQAGLRKGYYRKPAEDALIMTLYMGGGATQQNERALNA